MIELPIMATALAFTTVGGIMQMWKYRGDEKSEIIKAWNETMRHSNFYNKDAENTGKDKYLSTFEVYKCFKTDYGYKMIVTIPRGQKFSTLEDNKEIIENGLKANVEFLENKLSATATIKINNQEFDLMERWNPIKAEPYELYIGRNLFKKDIINDIHDYPHLMISGSNGTGKSICLFGIVANLIHNNPTQINLWLAQVSDKRDVQIFKNCKQTKYFAWNLDNAYDMFVYIRKIIKERNLELNKCNANNIGEYNKSHLKNQWTYEYIVIDEFSSFMVDDSKNIDAFFTIKKKCNVELQHLIKEGRSAGVIILTALQRPDKENLTPVIKSQFNQKLSFRQNNLASARVVCDEPTRVLRLPNREAVYEASEIFNIKTLYIDNNIILDAIKDSIEKNHKYIDLKDEIKSPQIDTKVVKFVSKQSKFKQSKVKENAKL